MPSATPASLLNIYSTASKAYSEKLPNGGSPKGAAMTDTMTEEEFRRELLEDELRWEAEEEQRFERNQLRKEMENYEPITYPY